MSEEPKGEFVNCEVIKPYRFNIELTGLELKHLMNALSVLSEFEPDECDECAKAGRDVEQKFLHAWEHMVKSFEVTGKSAVHQHDENGKCID